MRNAVVHLPDLRSAIEEADMLRAAARQLERADLYLAAVEAMDLDDLEARRALGRLRSDTKALRAYLGDRRSAYRR